jgi:hypothetical protein
MNGITCCQRMTYKSFLENLEFDSPLWHTFLAESVAPATMANDCFDGAQQSDNHA